MSGCRAALVILAVGSLAAAHAVHAEDGPGLEPAGLEAIRPLLDDRDDYQRSLGFLRLEALRDPATIPLIRGYLASADAQTRAYAVRALAAVEGAAAAPMLLQVLGADRSHAVRRAALLGLEPLHRSHPDILPAFIKALRDRKTDVRMTAVDVVSRIDDPQAKEAIRRRAARERRRDVQRVLKDAMKRLESG